MMGGGISVTSEEGLGSTFSFSFLGKATETPSAQTEKRGKDNGIFAGLASSHPLRILIAEDNSVNQQVLAGMLEQFGYSFDLVSNGREALNAVRQRSYDLILMDCHMPLVDGFAATRLIREPDSGAMNTVQIVAVTASTMQTDIDHCYASGMDDVISKPIIVDKLIDALIRAHARLSGPRLVCVPGPAAGSGAIGDQGAPSVDEDALLKNFRGMEDIAFDLARHFHGSLPKLLRSVETSVADRDGPATELAAHTLKGAASNLCAGPVRDIAAKLEQLGRAKDFTATDPLIGTLRDEVSRLESYLQSMILVRKTA